MIIESIIEWVNNFFMSMIGLLPENGNLFDSIPNLDFSAFKYVTLLNGYIPVKEFFAAFTIIVAVAAVLIIIKTILAIYDQIVKYIP